MTWGWALLLLLLMLLVLVLIIPVKIELHYKREGKDDRLHVGVRALFGLVRLGYDVPVVELLGRANAVQLKAEPAEGAPKEHKGWVTITAEMVEKVFRQVRRIAKRIAKYKEAIRRLTKSFRIESLEWRTMFGTGDAADTATLTGLGWGVKGVVGGVLYRFFRVKRRLFYDVKPHFQAKGFRTELFCIIRFRLGKTIFAGLTLVFLWLMEGIKWRNIRFKD